MYKRSIPPQRLLLYLLIVGWLPIFAAIACHVTERRRLVEACDVVRAIKYRAIVKQRKQALNRAVRAQYEAADHYYVDKYLESHSPLQAEAEGLAHLIADDPSLPNRDLLRRLEFLEGSENQLRFTEGAVETQHNIRETLEILTHPVEVSQADLPCLLARLEGRSLAGCDGGINPPQLMITEFKLHRKGLQGDNEVFLMDVKLIKREFL